MLPVRRANDQQAGAAFGVSADRYGLAPRSAPVGREHVGRVSITHPGDAAARVSVSRGDATRVSMSPQYLLFDGSNTLRMQHPRLNIEGHGTGCTLSAAIAAKLAQGWELEAACRDAADYVHGALRHASHPGKGDIAVLGHGWRENRSA